MLLYGFRALNKNIVLNSVEDEKRLEKSDYDLLLSLGEFNTLYNSFGDSVLSARPIKNYRYFIKTTKGNYDIHIIVNNESSNSFIYNNQLDYIIEEKSYDLFGNEFNVINLKTLFEFKKSHRMIRRNFKKTMKDYYMLLDLIGKESCIESDFYKLRLKETLVRADEQAKHINLNQSKEDFFNTKGVVYDYDHDSIHKSIKLHEEPLYKKILVPGKDVLCSKELWNKLSYKEKLESVLEESYTISIERYLAKGIDLTIREAFDMALEKVCTSLCKGWFREFAYENFKEVNDLFKEDYWFKFKNDYRKGLIKKF